MLNEFRAGDKINYNVLLKLHKIGATSTGGVFARGTVQDNSTVLTFVTFEAKAVDFLKECSAPTVLTVTGTVDCNKYSSDGALQLVISTVDYPAEDAELSHLLPYTPKDINTYQTLLKELITKIRRPHLNKLVKKIMSGEIYKKFIRNPAASSYHHAYIGGLVEHSVDVARLAEAMAHQVDNVDTDIVIAGALLHDIGKIYEISSEIGFCYTDVGKMIGHITLGALLVEREIAQLDDFSLEDKQHLLHIILSHHGTCDKGSPVMCASRESFLVHYADELNAILNQFDMCEQKDEWHYSKMLSRNIYVAK